MKLNLISSLACLALSVLSTTAQVYDGNSTCDSYAPDGIVFQVANNDWNPDGLGNHRAVVNVPLELDKKAVKVELNWRRPDLNPEIKGPIVVGAVTGKHAEHVYLETCNAEKGVIWFEPIKGEKSYFVYYMPYRLRHSYGDGRYEPQWNDYLPYDSAKGKEWFDRIAKEQPTTGKAALFESRNTFEFFTQMGNIATQKETQDILGKHQENPILFTEDRCFPIRLTKQLPVRWVNKEPRDFFEGTALRNEYYVWQIGVWAAHNALEKLHLAFSDMKQVNGDANIKASEITCFNQEGINWDGSPIKFDVNVPKDNIQALWCGVQVPQDIPAGQYKGKVTMTAEGMLSRTIDIVLNVKDEILADKGDNDLWRMARLRWLNSRLGLNDNFVAPFKAMKLSGNSVTATEKKVKLHRNGMPQSIYINKHEILSRPIDLEVETTSGGIVSFNSGKLNINKQANGLVTWNSEQESNGFKLLCEAQMEYDGHLNYKLSLSSSNDIKVKDVRLNTYYTEYTQEYMMGIGFVGGKRPKEFDWDWKGMYDSYWMGNAKAGLHMEFLGDVYHGPLLRDYYTTPPTNWWNKGKGHIYVKGDKEACVTASVGEKVITSNPLTLEFALDITPTKPVDTKKQFGMRFFHGYWKEFDKAAQEGANICNIHHANDLNPVINYPFIVQDSLKKFIRHEHEADRKVKLYYTVRELTSYTTEIYALQSLGTEILQKGHSHGAPWLCEHLIDFRPAWYTELQNGINDAAVVLSPQSRWINYYLEGLRWMLQNYEIDGIYMDDVSFDRNVMKRIRKIMAEYRPSAIIDLHSHDGYSAGPANSYTDFFPYIDRLWFGEGFKYNEMNPDRWFVTFSGIPFGPMSEMLQDGGNLFLGTVYGASNRHSYGPTPAHIWKLWKDFDIENSEMVGYWDDNCPVHTTGDDVKATAYVHKGKKCLVAIGNFSDKEQTVTLDINWKFLKLNPGKVTMKTPEVEEFQKQQTFKFDEAITIKAKEGVMLLIE